MAKKVIRLTESDLTRIVNKVIKEQTEERNFVKGIQTFLNSKGAKLAIDGKTGPNSQTEKAIMAYQNQIGVNPTDGKWGQDTWNKMPEKDRVLLKKMIAQQGGLIDVFLNKLGL